MPDLNANQFRNHLPIYRGFADRAPADIKLGGVGTSWSKDPDIAQGFADFSWDGASGTVLHGLVHPKDVMSSEEVLKTQGNDISENREEEVPVRHGAKVWITGHSHDGEETMYESPIEARNGGF
jgi:hypothetical protein